MLLRIVLLDEDVLCTLISLVSPRSLPISINKTRWRFLQLYGDFYFFVTSGANLMCVNFLKPAIPWSSNIDGEMIWKWPQVQISIGAHSLFNIILYIYLQFLVFHLDFLCYLSKLCWHDFSGISLCFSIICLFSSLNFWLTFTQYILL